MARSTTIINKFGKMTGWNNITMHFLSRDIEGVTEIRYDDTVDKKNAPGAGMFPVGRGDGNYEAKASVSLYKEEVDALQDALPIGRRIQDIDAFDIIVEYERKDGRIVKDVIRNAEFTNNVVEVKNGDGTISKKLELIISHIDWNVI